jgi:hypothetical protein
LKYAGGFGNNTFTSDQREKALLDLIEKLQPGQWLILEHPAFDTPEMRNIGHPGYENVAADRAGVTNAFTSAKACRVSVRAKKPGLFSNALTASSTMFFSKRAGDTRPFIK